MSFKEITFPEDIKNKRDVSYTYYLTRKFPVKNGSIFILNPDENDFGCMQMYDGTLKTYVISFMHEIKPGILTTGYAIATSCSTGLLINGIPLDMEYIIITLKDLHMLPRIVYEEGKILGMYDAKNINHCNNDYTKCSCKNFPKSCNCNDDTDDSQCSRHTEVDSSKMSYEPTRRVSVVRVKI